VLEHILDGTMEPTNLPFELLKNITNNFSEEQKIGQGGFGSVYKVTRSFSLEKIRYIAHLQQKTNVCDETYPKYSSLFLWHVVKPDFFVLGYYQSRYQFFCKQKLLFGKVKIVTTEMNMLHIYTHKRS